MINPHEYETIRNLVYSLQQTQQTLKDRVQDLYNLANSLQSTPFTDEQIKLLEEKVNEGYI